MLAALGLVLLCFSAAFLVDLAITTGGTTSAHIFGYTLSGIGSWELFLFGVAAGFVAAVGLGLLLTGTVRGLRGRREHNRAVGRHRAEAQRLAAELERERAAHRTTAEEAGVEPYPSEPALDPAVHTRTGDRPVDHR